MWWRASHLISLRFHFSSVQGGSQSLPLRALVRSKVLLPARCLRQCLAGAVTTQIEALISSRSHSSLTRTLYSFAKFLEMSKTGNCHLSYRIWEGIENIQHKMERLLKCVKTYLPIVLRVCAWTFLGGTGRSEGNNNIRSLRWRQTGRAHLLTPELPSSLFPRGTATSPTWGPPWARLAIPGTL